MRTREAFLLMAVLSSAACGSKHQHADSHPRSSAGARSVASGAGGTDSLVDAAVSGTGAAGEAGSDGGAGAAGNAGSGGATAPSHCETSPPHTLRLVVASLASATPHFEHVVDLSGPGVAGVFALSAAGVPHLLTWGNGSLLSLGQDGFWDIPFATPPQWLPLPGIVVGALAGDLDGDGDQDVIVANTRVEQVERNGAQGPESVTHVIAWERTAGGLAERSHILTTGPVLFIPYTLADIDKDGDLDLLAYMDGIPLGYLNDGEFGFSRKTLGPQAEAYKTRDVAAEVIGAIALSGGDRNGDGAADLLAVMGTQHGIESIVMLNDGKGMLLPPAPGVKDLPPSAGLLLADVTGDGLVDVIGDGSHATPGQELRLTASRGPASFAEPVSIAPDRLGLRAADVDEDGTLDVITMVDGRTVALMARGDHFEQRDLHLTLPPDKLDFTTDPGEGSAPARLFVTQQLCDP